ncbi:hypothetical protein GCM10028862_09610 [Luteimonas pelagia]
MAHMPVLAIGRDAAWRTRMQRLLALRGDVDWLGAFAPAEPRRARGGPADVLLLDGDDPAIDRAPRRPYQPSPRRVYFFRHPDLRALERCGRALAHGCLDKLAPAEAILMTVHAVEVDLCVISPPLLHQLANAVDPLAWRLGGPGSGLTPRQLEILRWASAGLSNKQIARRLGISPETVKSHLHAAFQREGVTGRAALVARALGIDAREGTPPVRPAVRPPR